ncbi:MAG TPA: sigma-70 family RNA polymerase sigma factor [Gemmataceae bacterium]|nr:sigma-70 family RNA polymerase sigma factor [Gemmataceae bacterium]
MPMPDPATFLRLLRSHDTKEADQLLRQYEPILCQAIHLRLLDGRLRHLLETADIFQSLVLDFLTQQPGPATGPGDLHAYLAQAVRKKVLARLRKERRRVGELSPSYDGASPELPAEWLAEARDAIEAVRARLPQRERELLDLVGEGLSWPAIAAQVGGTPAALRMRLGRAIARARAQLEMREAQHAS